MIFVFQKTENDYSSKIYSKKGKQIEKAKKN